LINLLDVHTPLTTAMHNACDCNKFEPLFNTHILLYILYACFGKTNANLVYAQAILRVFAGEAETQEATASELEQALLAESLGCKTPQDRIRRTMTAPRLSDPKKSNPVAKKKKIKKRKIAKKPQEARHASPAFTEANESSPEPPAPAEVPVQPKGEKATAAKSAAKPPTPPDNSLAKAEVATPPPPKDEVATPAPPKDEVATPAPPEGVKVQTPTSEARRNATKEVNASNLQRATTASQLASAPPPPPFAMPGGQPVPPAPPVPSAAPVAARSAPTSTAPSDVTSTTDANADANAVAVPKKKRREKTEQEKANHARFMRFTRHIQSF